MADKVADTAVGPILIAAAEWQLPAGKRLCTDEIAQHMLPGPARALLRAGLVRRMLVAAMARAAPGSTLGFTYVQQDFLDGTNRYDAPKMRQRFVIRDPIWKFGLIPAQVPDLLAEYGWQQIEQAGAAEYRTRYLIPAGRTEPVSDVERCVRAVKS